MSKHVAVPFPKMRLDAAERMAEAAGFAPACAYESSDEWHNALVVRWRRRTRRARLSTVSPSIPSLCLALLLVVM